MNIRSAFWIRTSIINLCIVALFGAAMRYKIGFELPFLDQKYLQEAHSHFAFGGWITQTLFFLLVLLFRSNLPDIREKVYQSLLVINLICSYGMLISFSVQGYGPVSLVFSSASLVTGYIFSYFAWRDANRLEADHPAKSWIKAAIFFGLLSTIGTVVLSNMMFTHLFDQKIYLGSVYFYLHFQYNGWFLFACIGLFLNSIKHIMPSQKHARLSFWFFFLAGIPAYFLSTLWAHLPVWLYAIVILAAMLQVIGWWFLLRLIRMQVANLKLLFSRTALLLFLVVASAMTIKILLQMGSTVPAINKLAFGFRPIVIAYLHLVLLLIVSVFLLTFMYANRLLHQNRYTRLFLLTFTGGAILNEMVLAIQGIAAFSYAVIPYANEILFFIAMILLVSACLLMLSQWNPPVIDTNHLKE